MLHPHSRVRASRNPLLPFPVSSHHSVLSFPASSRKRGQPLMATSVRIAIVGDVHDDWDLEEDSKALGLLQPNLVLFTGDFGNENAKLVKSIANLDFPKAAILGNHDCWNTHSFSQKKSNKVHLQLEYLGKQHVGYSRLDLPILKLSIIGGRPFSHGGPKMFRPKLLLERYGVNNMKDSANKIIQAAQETPEGHFLVLLAHNGPAGLGSKMEDICGRDWVKDGGDYGDPDLTQALLELSSNKEHPIPLVVFGHMHNRLAYGRHRKMIVVGANSTIYLNAAIVPRVKRLYGTAGSSRNVNAIESKGHTLRVFTLVEILNGIVERISETWVLVTDKKAELKEENILFQRH